MNKINMKYVYYLPLESIILYYIGYKNKRKNDKNEVKDE